MRPVTPQDRKDALRAFVDLPDDAGVTVIDRSELELWAECPFKASVHATGKVNFPAVLHVGNEVHDALSRTTRQWIETDGMIRPGELRDEVMAELRGSRPDLQPDVISAFAASAYSWAAFLAANCHPGNIIGFDGGDDLNRSGQLAIDFDELSVRPTSELDLLYSGPSPELLHEVDYKTGHTIYTAATVAHSFQFQLHALLVFTNFPNVRGLEVTVWNTRTNSRTYKVVFDRKRIGDYTARVKMAVQSWATNRDNPPPWPTWEKCSGCVAAALCPAAGHDIGDAAKDPVAVLRQLIASEAKSDALKKALTAYVDSRKTEIVADGVAFGRSKPPSNRKSPAALYKLAADKDDETEG